MKTYFTQEVLDAVKEKISKFQAGGTTAEIRPDNRSWIRREIVDPVRTWIMTRPGYETAVQTADVVSDFVPGVGEVKDLIRGNYLAAAIGLVPGIGDVAAKVVKNPVVKKITVLPEGVSFLSEKQSKRLAEKANERMRRQGRKPFWKETWQETESRNLRDYYKRLEDIEEGQRRQKFLLGEGSDY